MLNYGILDAFAGKTITPPCGIYIQMTKGEKKTLRGFNRDKCIAVSGRKAHDSSYAYLHGRDGFMPDSLFDRNGVRKYLTARERLAFVYAASDESAAVLTFCLTLVFTGARISEVLALTASRIDAAAEAIVFETLKQRKKQTFRAVPIPRPLILLLTTYGLEQPMPLWPWGRTTGWKIVQGLMRSVGIAEAVCQPKALRHAFAVEAGQQGVPLNIVQRWLGHARIETTAIYASAIGDEERNLARRSWGSLERAIPDQTNLSKERPVLPREARQNEFAPLAREILRKKRVSVRQPVSSE